MQRSITHGSASLRRARKTAMAIALVCSLGVSTAHAQFAVIDAGDIAQTTATAGSTALTATNTLTTAANTLTTATNTLNTVTQITSTISSIASNPLAVLIPSNTNLTELSQSQITSLINGKCPLASSGGNIVTGAISSAVQSLDPNASIAVQQQMICSNIVWRQADQYNATVDLFLQMPQLHNSMAGLQGMMQQLNGLMGNASSAAAQTSNFTAAEQDEISQWNTRMQMDKSIIDTLNQQQSILAAVSMNAQPDLLGSSVQAAALATAFSINQ
jgi:hypothetical protein